MASAEQGSTPTISLPKGGGAMRGIGETFAPDLHTGTGNFTIPIEVPSGRHGLQPGLALNYSTGNGNGPFGLGWSLSVPSVSRKTSKGIPRYGSGSDTYLLSGAEDLVPVDSSAGVTRYRPRTEGVFARIDHHQSDTTDHWRVGSKDGLTSYYGVPDHEQRDPAAVASPANEQDVFEWKLSRTEDSFGNFIQYDYTTDLVDDAEHSSRQVYLDRIQYADHAGDDGGIAFLVSVSLVYEDRPDPYSSHRAGFEIRTRKRCTAIEVRTHAGQTKRVRSYQLIYLDQRGLPPEQLPLNAVSLLSQIVVVGHDGEQDQSLPPIEFRYSAFEPHQRRFTGLLGEMNAMPGRSLADSELTMLDLFGQGLPDIVQVNDQVRYWRNLGNGRFDAPRTMAASPLGFRLGDPGVQLLDANGNGRADLMIFDGTRSGYFPMAFTGGWNEHGYRLCPQGPSVDLNAPDVRLIDLDGDGVTDALRTGTNLELFYNDPALGWNRVEVLTRREAADFPNVSFADPRVKLADITGEGLQSILMVEDGAISYWPHCGHGRWGRRVHMLNSPRFEEASHYPGTGFDPKRLLLGDVDGDGLADLIYVSSGYITVWINQAGNAWSEPIVIHGTPPVVDTASIRLADMLGQGTDGILWTYDLATFRDSAYKFLDLTGGVKPYVLAEMDNHMGALTKVGYASSTRFYLADQQRPETRWKTPLPFPVQVVARVEVIDQISHGKLTTEYHYRHGYWDGVEREFRGFGHVEQQDTESFDDYHAHGLHAEATSFDAVPEKHFSPPTLTKTWFHQGAIGDENGDWHEPNWSAEHWGPDRQELAHAMAINIALATLPTARAKRDALRALRGSVLRTELYALDGSPRQTRPFTVSEFAYSVRREADAGDGHGAPLVFFPHLIAQRTTQWERGDDPATQFALYDDHDAFGNPGSQINIAVPRGRNFRRPVPAAEPYIVTQVVNTLAHRDDDQHYLIGRNTSTSTYEVANDGRKSYFQLYLDIRAHLLPRQLIAQSFNYYDGPAYQGLPFGQLGRHGALVRTETLALTEAILQAAYPQLPPSLQSEHPGGWPTEYPIAFVDSATPLAGYRFADGTDHRQRGHWVQTTQRQYDFQATAHPRPRGLLSAAQDALGAETRFSYDRYQLMLTAVVDAAALTQTAEYDYRLMQPSLVTDANGNRQRFGFSPLGLPTELYLMGQDGRNEGDQARPGTRFIHDLHAFEERRQPASVRAIRQVHHDTAADVPLAERDDTIEAIEYSDGFGRVIQTRTQAQDLIFDDNGLPAEPAMGVVSAEFAGRRPADAAAPHVVVSGWQVYDNKGRVVQKHEPFFSAGWGYSPPAEAERGQKVQLFYDPRGQVIRTLNPDGSEQRVVYGVPTALDQPDTFRPSPWEAYTYDANDLAPLSRSPEGASLAGAAPRHHHFTPAHIVIDPLGRTVLAITRNRRNLDEPLAEVRTASSYDTRGNLLTVTDALGRVAFTYQYDLLNRALRTHSIDAGERRLVLDALGQEIERRDSKGALIVQAYDSLHRPLHLWARDDPSAAVTLRQIIEYGDAGNPDQTTAERQTQRAAHRLGRVHRHHDEAGRLTFHAYDFKGNLLDKTRGVISDDELKTVFDQPNPTGYAIDWQPRGGETLDAVAARLLEARPYQTSQTFDALNRVRDLHYPLDQDGERKVLHHHYNRAGALERMVLGTQTFVSHIAYNAKGQRSFIARGNGILTRYAYHPRTLRLQRMRSERCTSVDDSRFKPQGGLLQDYSYRYDLVGNILSIADRVPGCGVINTPEGPDALTRRFEYDAIYQLISATGRESSVQPGDKPWMESAQRAGFNSPNHGSINQDNAPSLTTPYWEIYEYDAAGNATALRHNRSDSSFVRTFTNPQNSNRLAKMAVATSTFVYAFDDNGNTTKEADGRRFHWNHADQMRSFWTQSDAIGTPLIGLYLYDAYGLRVKKFILNNLQHQDTTVYIEDAYEENTWRTGENSYVKIGIGGSTEASLRIGDTYAEDPSRALKFFLTDHRVDSTVTVDLIGDSINREEFSPFGETTFGSFARKRFRFTGKERDDESGLFYHNKRYLNAALMRWCSADPKGPVDGSNLYQYCRSNPIVYIDPDGTKCFPGTEYCQEAGPSEKILGADNACSPEVAEDLGVQPSITSVSNKNSTNISVKPINRGQMLRELKSTGNKGTPTEPSKLPGHISAFEDFTGPFLQFAAGADLTGVTKNSSLFKFADKSLPIIGALAVATDKLNSTPLKGPVESTVDATLTVLGDYAFGTIGYGIPAALDSVQPYLFDGDTPVPIGKTLSGLSTMTTAITVGNYESMENANNAALRGDLGYIFQGLTQFGNDHREDIAPIFDYFIGVWLIPLDFDQMKMEMRNK